MSVAELVECIDLIQEEWNSDPQVIAQAKRFITAFNDTDLLPKLWCHGPDSIVFEWDLGIWGTKYVTIGANALAILTTKDGKITGRAAAIIPVAKA